MRAREVAQRHAASFLDDLYDCFIVLGNDNDSRAFDLLRVGEVRAGVKGFAVWIEPHSSWYCFCGLSLRFRLVVGLIGAEQLGHKLPEGECLQSFSSDALLGGDNLTLCVGVADAGLLLSRSCDWGKGIGPNDC